MIKMMIDTNVIIDYLTDRLPFADYSERIIDMCALGNASGFLTASAATDIYYVTSKTVGREKALDNLKALFGVINIADVGKKDLLHAMDLDMNDFEDALVSVCAKRIKADYIVTRNERDFVNSPVAPITPEIFIKRYNVSEG